MHSAGFISNMQQMQKFKKQISQDENEEPYN